MKNRILIFALVIVSFVLQSCTFSNSGGLRSELIVSTPTPEKKIINEKKVEFEGVNFTYNPQIFGEIKGKINEAQPLEKEDDKPDENFPKHIEFSFGKDSSNKNRIAVVPIAEHRKMYAVSKELTVSFDENHKNLRKALDDEKFRVEGEIPFIPFYDAHQAIIARVKKTPFQNGKSICFLTQYEQDTNLINNENISYYCQGITNDEKYYFLAEFPLNISFLPKDAFAEEFEGYKISSNTSKDEVTKYKNYISKLTERINKLSPEEFEPNLNELEKIILTIKIEKVKLRGNEI